jgi:hypothetical protein
MPQTLLPTFDPALRIATLHPDLTFRQLHRRFRRSRVVAAEAPLLCELAELIDSGRLSVPLPEAAVVVFTGAGRAELTDLERDLFWRVFQVPVFEQLLAADGHILAMECDAHDGLHLLDPAAAPAQICALWDTTPCGCGNPHPRLIRTPRWDSSNAPAMVGAPTYTSHVEDDSQDQHQQVRPAGRVA